MAEYQKLPLPLKLTELQKETEFYKSHYSILQKNFRNIYDRLRSEAFYIRMLRPKLNIQTNTQKYFKLFWKSGFKFFSLFTPKLKSFLQFLDIVCFLTLCVSKKKLYMLNFAW